MNTAPYVIPVHDFTLLTGTTLPFPRVSAVWMTAHNIKIPHQSIPRHLFISGFMLYDFVCNTRAAASCEYTHGLNDRKTAVFFWNIVICWRKCTTSRPRRAHSSLSDLIKRVLISQSAKNALSNERTHADVSHVVRSLEGCQINVLYRLPRTPALIALRHGFTGDNTHRGLPRVAPTQAFCCAQNFLILPASHIIIFPRRRRNNEKRLEILCWLLLQAESLASRYLNPLCAYAEKYQTFFE